MRPTRHLLLAHGSPDPRHAAFVRSLASGVTARGLRCRAAFLEHDEPGAAACLAGASGRVVTLGLLLAPGFHARSDVPRLRAAAPASVDLVERGVLGSGPWLHAAADEVVAAAGGDAATDVLLVGAGSARREAIAHLASYADGWGATRSGTVRLVDLTGLAAAAREWPEAVVVPHLVAPGVLGDRILRAAADAGLRATPVLGAADAFVPALVARLAPSPLPGRAGAIDMAV